jgi:hypothetical protein
MLCEPKAGGPLRTTTLRNEYPPARPVRSGPTHAYLLLLAQACHGRGHWHAALLRWAHTCYTPSSASCHPHPSVLLRPAATPPPPLRTSAPDKSRTSVITTSAERAADRQTRLPSSPPLRLRAPPLSFCDYALASLAKPCAPECAPPSPPEPCVHVSSRRSGFQTQQPPHRGWLALHQPCLLTALKPPGAAPANQRLAVTGPLPWLGAAQSLPAIRDIAPRGPLRARPDARPPPAPLTGLKNRNTGSPALSVHDLPLKAPPRAHPPLSPPPPRLVCLVAALRPLEGIPAGVAPVPRSAPG